MRAQRLLALSCGLWLALSKFDAAAQTTPARDAEQSIPPPTAANGSTPDKVDALLERLAALEAELARQRQQLDAARAALDAQRAADSSAEARADPAALADLIEQTKDEHETVSEEPLVRLYGFADVGLQRLWADSEISEISPETNKTTFVLGNVNLYLDANPSQDFRFLAEIRFGLFPDGSVDRPKGGWSIGARTETSVSDPSAANAFFTSVRWAGVLPERAQIDWTPSDHFNLRAGLFLTPYGIWNVDHGTPTRIMVSEPLFLSSQLIPSRLIGVEAFGTVAFLPWTLGYHLHISNGRTYGQVDFSDTKAIGGRLYLSTRNPFPFKIGLSGYLGDLEDVQTALSMRKTTIEFDEYAISGDLSLDIGALRLRSEVVVSWTYYEPGKRSVLAGVPQADVMHLGAYLVLAYQLPWAGLEPLIMTEIIRVPLPRLLPIGEGMIMPAVGLNAYFSATTMLRTQISIAHGFDLASEPVHPKGFLYQAVARLITAF